MRCASSHRAGVSIGTTNYQNATPARAVAALQLGELRAHVRGGERPPSAYRAPTERPPSDHARDASRSSLRGVFSRERPLHYKRHGDAADRASHIHRVSDRALCHDRGRARRACDHRCQLALSRRALRKCCRRTRRAGRARPPLRRRSKRACVFEHARQRAAAHRVQRPRTPVLCGERRSDLEERRDQSSSWRWRAAGARHVRPRLDRCRRLV